MTSPEWAFVALGSNEGDRQRYLRLGRNALARARNTRFVAATAVIETEPLGNRPQPAYLNQMVLLHTEMPPRALLRLCQRVEDRAGRVRRERWGPRTLDLDIVLYGDREIDEADLQVPHPELANRPFWLRQLAALAPAVRAQSVSLRPA